MGVPSFFRWLQRKYPEIIINAIEERKRDEHGNIIPIDCLEPNLNHQEFDNLYLDMNGIIHPCTHPEHRPPPKTEEEMFVLIFEYIDRLFAIIRPRRLLYMAIDGVAPRAKMNQQRSRRFRAAKEAIEKEQEISMIREKLESEGIPLPPLKKREEKFDSNCITPGTPFMDRLAIALRYYVHNKVTLDPAWENIEVILSDANVPGEGEHKIMDYIRRQRSSPSHDPNTSHCLCGADADLIMLGLATHESNFTIIREEFIPNQPRPCDLCHMYGHELKDCRGLASDEKKLPLCHGEPNFIFISLSILREYLEREMKDCDYPFDFDLERAIDDWVFMCFFVGNDFLPHLPSLEIREGAIDRLIRLYKENIWSTDGWLTDAGEVNIRRVEIMMKSLGKAEDEIFRRRKAREERFKKGKRVPRRRGQFVPQNFGVVNPLDKPDTINDEAKCNEMTLKLKALFNIEPTVDESGKAPVIAPWHVMKEPEIDSPSSDASEKLDTTITVSDSESEEAEPYDDVKLHEPGWKERYYTMKFGAGCDSEEFRKKIALDYVEGLCWVLKYYYQGCASWDWYFPHHYAPFASDFDDISQYSPDFSNPTTPFNPLEQLMAVFPAASRDHIPKAWHKLMTDPKSPLAEFYPNDFEIDLNGKKFAWQGVALLPFVDQKLLLDELHKVYDQLTDGEKARNIRGTDRVFISSNHQLFDKVLSVYTKGKIEAKTDGTLNWFDIDSECTNGLSGQVAYDKDGVLPGDKYKSFSNDKETFPDINPNKCLMLAYLPPQYDGDHLFSVKRLDGIVELERTLKERPDRRYDGRNKHAHLDASGHRMIKFYTKNGNKCNAEEFKLSVNYSSSNSRHNDGNNRYHRQEFKPSRNRSSDRPDRKEHRGYRNHEPLNPFSHKSSQNDEAGPYRNTSYVQRPNEYNHHREHKSNEYHRNFDHEKNDPNKKFQDRPRRGDTYPELRNRRDNYGSSHNERNNDGRPRSRGARRENDGKPFSHAQRDRDGHRSYNERNDDGRPNSRGPRRENDRGHSFEDVGERLPSRPRRVYDRSNRRTSKDAGGMQMILDKLKFAKQQQE